MQTVLDKLVARNVIKLNPPYLFNARRLKIKISTPATIVELAKLSIFGFYNLSPKDLTEVFPLEPLKWFNSISSSDTIWPCPFKCDSLKYNLAKKNMGARVIILPTLIKNNYRAPNFPLELVGARILRKFHQFHCNGNFIGISNIHYMPTLCRTLMSIGRRYRLSKLMKQRIDKYKIDNSRRIRNLIERTNEETPNILALYNAFTNFANNVGALLEIEHSYIYTSTLMFGATIGKVIDHKQILPSWEE